MAESLILTPDTAIFARFPNLVRQSAELSQAYADQKLLVTDAELQAIGMVLWQALDAEEKLRTAKQQAGQAILPLVIASDDPDILQLPWETLYHPDYGFLARHEGFTLFRIIPSITNGLPDIEPGPLKILLFSSLPDDLDETDQLQIETEQGQVLEALGQWRQSGHVVLEMPDDGRFSEFKRILKSFKPHLVYLSGHGVFRSDPLNHHDKGYFLFENEHGDVGELVDEDQLTEAFTGINVQCVILSACQTGKAVSANLNNGLMYSLVQKGIPHVIGMRESILDRAGIQFAHAFFEALIDKKGIALALQEARQAIKLPLKDDENAKKSIFTELSLGQWCLPMLLSREHDRSLINWQFTPQPMRAANLLNESLDRITLPAQFIGRRRELRKLQREFREGKTSVLLLTGAGGMGKTALAGKLFSTLKADGFEIFGFSARAEHDWRDTLFQMKLMLDKERNEKYSLIQQQYPDPAKQAAGLLKLVLEQFQRKVAIFFDNLESVQDTVSRTIIDPELLIWINAAVGLKKEGLRVLLTSRWALPEWKELVYPLGKPVYRDFLAVAQQQKLPKSFHRESKRLRKAYEVLNGNYRALEFFAAALKDMDAGEEVVFLQQLQKAEAEIQVDMALEKVWSHRTAEEQELLRRMIAFEVPVASEGLQKLAMPDLPPPEEAQDVLLSVSLIERYENQQWKTDEFLVSSPVRDWMEKRGIAKPEPELLQQAASYHQWLLENERWTPGQAMITHAALMVASMDEEAHKVTLKWIVSTMNMAGMYQILLEDYLLPASKSTVPVTLAEALGQTGIQYLHIGQYDEALDFFKRSLVIMLEIGSRQGVGAMFGNIASIYNVRGQYDESLVLQKRSLAIMQEIGDKKGEGVTLNNIANNYLAQEQYDEALYYLNRSLAIRQEIGDQQGVGTTLGNISKIYDANSQNNENLYYLKRALAIQQEIGDRKGEYITLNMIANNYLVRGQYDEALVFQRRSLAIMQEIGDKKGEGVTLNNIANNYLAQEQYDEALYYLNRSLAIRQEIGDRHGESVILNNISQLYQDNSQLDKALDFLNRSLAISKEIGDLQGEGITLNNISQVYQDNSQLDKALDFLNCSLAISQKIGDRTGLSATLFNIGHIYIEQDDIQNAISTWVAAYQVAREVNYAEVLQELADLAPQLGLPEGFDGWEMLAKQMD
jgi:tetratricopeptide (TPR) repeat protein